MHEAEEISMSWGKKNRDEVCQTGTTYLLSANKAVLTAEQNSYGFFFHCLRLEGLCFMLEYCIYKSGGSCICFCTILGHLLLSLPATVFYWLNICGPSFGSSVCVRKVNVSGSLAVLAPQETSFFSGI